MIRQLLILMLSLAALAACTVRPGPEVLTPHPEARDAAAHQVRIYAASNRAVVNGYEGLPAFTTTYRYFDISVPRERPGDQIAWPGVHPDPRREYLVLETGVLTRNAFLAATAGAGQGPLDTTGLYIHGYNTRYQEALFRLAQIAAEAETGAAPVLYSWPSTGRALEYEADRQAALLSRRALSELIVDLTRNGDRRLLVFGHSMGGFLTMESLRSLKLAGRDRVLNQLDVVLAAPDINVQSFIEFMEETGPLAAPMIILSSPDDRALALSSQISDGQPRLGALPANSDLVAEAARRANIQIIDISDLQADPMRHLRYIRMAELYTRQLEAAPELRLPGAYIFDALSRSLIAP